MENSFGRAVVVSAAAAVVFAVAAEAAAHGATNDTSTLIFRRHGFRNACHGKIFRRWRGTVDCMSNTVYCTYYSGLVGDKNGALFEGSNSSVSFMLKQFGV